MKTIILFDSLGGNTKKVADRIYETAKAKFVSTDIVKVTKQTELDFMEYDLIFAGSPVIDWLPTQTMLDYIRKCLKGYSEKGLIKPSSPIVPGKFAICFGTYAGPHIGVNEARPMTMWMRSAFEHVGYTVLDEWHVPGQFTNKPELNKYGRLGNIEGRPNDHDLADIENRVKGTLASITAFGNNL